MTSREEGTRLKTFDELVGLVDEAYTKGMVTDRYKEMEGFGRKYRADLRAMGRAIEELLREAKTSDHWAKSIRKGMQSK